MFFFITKIKNVGSCGFGPKPFINIFKKLKVKVKVKS